MLVVSIILLDGSPLFSKPDLLETVRSPQFMNMQASKFICKSTD